MKKATILIIGAGPAGLAAGIYAQRKGYTIDDGVRLLSGTSPLLDTGRLWQELGVLRNRAIYYYDEFVCYEGCDGRRLPLYTNIDRLEKHLLEFSPADKDTITHFCKCIHQFTRMETPLDLTPSSPLESLEIGRSMLPVLLPLLAWQKETAGAFAGWAMTTRKMSMMMGKTMSRSLPGLADFFMIGQWVEPGGNVELAAASGRDVLKDICALDSKPFVSGSD